MIHVLRYAEYLAVAPAVGEPATISAAFGSQVCPVAAKLLADVCGFLVTASGVRPEFRDAARDRLVVDLTGGTPSHAPKTNADSEALKDVGRGKPRDLPLPLAQRGDPEA
jgi:hypothetical protein